MSSQKVKQLLPKNWLYIIHDINVYICYIISNIYIYNIYMLSRLLPIRQWFGGNPSNWANDVHDDVVTLITLLQDLSIVCVMGTKVRGKQYVGHTISRWNNHKSDVRNVKNGDMENVKKKKKKNFFLKISCYKVITKPFLKKKRLGLLIKCRLLILLSGSFTGWEHWEICILMTLILEVTFGSLFRFLYFYNSVWLSMC